MVNLKIAMVNPIYFGLSCLGAIILSYFTVAEDPVALQMIGYAAAFYIWACLILWPNFVRAALHAADATLIKDIYFYTSIILFLTPMVLFLVDTYFPYAFWGRGVLWVFEGTMLGQLLGFFALIGFFGLYANCYRAFLDDFGPDQRSSTWPHFSAGLAFMLLPVGGSYFIHRGIVRFREEMGWPEGAG